MVPFQDAIKEVMAGRYQMFFGAQGAIRPMDRASHPVREVTATTNLSRFSFPEYDRAAEQFMRAATEAERVAAARTMTEVANNYAPFIRSWYAWTTGSCSPGFQDSVRRSSRPLEIHGRRCGQAIVETTRQLMLIP
jgi:hypothetical protein